MFPSYNQVMANLSAPLNSLEDERKQTSGFIKKHALLFIASLLLTILLLIMLSSSALIFLLFIVIVYGIVIVWKSSKKYQKLRHDFKEKIVWGMAKELVQLCELPGATDDYQYRCEYDPKQRIQDGHIHSSRLFNFKIDKTRGEDLFYGTIGLTEFRFSELTLIQVQTSTDSKGHTTSQDVKMFDGILFVADFHKEFEGVTVLRSANIFNTGVIAGWLRPLSNMFSIFSREKKTTINLENEDFNRAFHVQTTDEIKARYILSSSMMERLLSFKQKHPEKVEMSFVESRMYVALSSGRNYFELKLREPLTGKQTQVIYDDLIFFFGMIEDFDLNTRIWSKQ